MLSYLIQEFSAELTGNNRCIFHFGKYGYQNFP